MADNAPILVIVPPRTAAKWEAELVPPSARVVQESPSIILGVRFSGRARILVAAHLPDQPAHPHQEPQHGQCAMMLNEESHRAPNRQMQRLQPRPVHASAVEIVLSQTKIA